ncbi:MAG: hypothetical protein LBL99_03960 [Holosporaceae bacterium]|jgi:hypothetical protein|nr:hypothetical protein [Holosporaceae bacterium]
MNTESKTTLAYAALIALGISTAETAQAGALTRAALLAVKDRYGGATAGFVVRAAGPKQGAKEHTVSSIFAFRKIVEIGSLVQYNDWTPQERLDQFLNTQRGPIKDTEAGLTAGHPLPAAKHAIGYQLTHRLGDMSRWPEVRELLLSYFSLPRGLKTTEQRTFMNATELMVAEVLRHDATDPDQQAVIDAAVAAFDAIPKTVSTAPSGTATLVRGAGGITHW